MLNNIFKKIKIPRKKIILYLTILILISIIFSSYKNNRDYIYITIKPGLYKDISSVAVYKKSPEGKISSLKKDGDIWRSSKSHVKKIWICLPQDSIKNIEEAQISIGKKTFNFFQKDISTFNVIPESKLMPKTETNKILEVPDFVRGGKSVLLKLLLKDSLNWRGDLAFLKVIVKNSAICLFVLLVLFIYIKFRYSKCLIFLLSLIIVAFFGVTQVDPHHDGIMLKPAIDVANGKMLHKDTFSQYGTLTTLIQAYAVKFFGERLIVIRMLTALCYGLISILVWLIFSRILPRELNTFSCIIWILLLYFWIDYPAMFIFPWSTVFAILSILLALYFLILFLEKQNYFLLLAVGITTSLVLWFKINYGVTSFLFTLLLLITLNIFNNKKTALKNLFVFLLGNTVMHTIFIVWLSANGALKDFILQSVELAFAFAINNKFSTDDPFVIKIIKNLLQIGSTHGGISAIWTILPIISMGVLVCSFYNFIKRKTLLSDKITLAIAFTSAGLWLGYYPINALFHMSLSSVLFIGLLTYSLWQLAEKFHIKNQSFLVIIGVLAIVFYDLSFKMDNGLRKISKIKEYQKIETPKFLCGMYVANWEKQVYEEIGELVDTFPYYNLINLTNSGLYSLYKKNNDEFHKMYVAWGWNNSYLYPDYIAKLAKRISMKSDMIFSHDNLIIEGYVPIRVFPALNGGRIMDFSKETIFLVPGQLKNIFEISEIGTTATLNNTYFNKNYYHLKLKLKSSDLTIINSIIVRVFTKNNIPKKINKNEFDYNIIPRILNKEDRMFIKNLYSFNKQTNEYSISEIEDMDLTNRLIDVFSKIFLCEKYFYLADTFKITINNKIDVYLNKKIINYKERDLLDISCVRHDVVDLIIPIANVPNESNIKLRINYNDRYYCEQTIKTGTNFVEEIVWPLINNGN